VFDEAAPGADGFSGGRDVGGTAGFSVELVVLLEAADASAALGAAG